MAPKTNTKSATKSEQQCGNNDNTDVCPKAPFSGGPGREETNTLTCLASRWADFYMLWFFLLEGIFERTVRLGFAEIFQCNCHLQCQICFGLGDGQHTEGPSNIWVSSGCSHYFYAKICSQMTSGGDLCHLGASIDQWNKSMNCSLLDTVFTGRSFGGHATSLVREWKVYYSLV